MNWENKVARIKSNVNDIVEADELKARLNILVGEADVSKSDGSIQTDEQISLDDHQPFSRIHTIFPLSRRSLRNPFDRIRITMSLSFDGVKKRPIDIGLFDRTL